MHTLGIAVDCDALVRQLVGGADHRDPVSRCHGQIASGTGNHLPRLGAVLTAQHGDGSEIAVELAQRGVAGRVVARDEEVVARHGNRVCGAAQARLDHRRTREFCNIEHRPRTVAERDSVA